MTDSELTQLAQDIFKDKVFGSWMIKPEHLDYLERIFVPLQWTGKDKNPLPNDVASLYEYRDKAWPLKIEEYPVFFSMKFLTKEELVKLQSLIQKLNEIWSNIDEMGSNSGISRESSESRNNQE